MPTWVLWTSLDFVGWYVGGHPLRHLFRLLAQRLQRLEFGNEPKVFFTTRGLLGLDQSRNRQHPQSMSVQFHFFGLLLDLFIKPESRHLSKQIDISCICDEREI